MSQQLFRIIDANLNRTREALRVCEDIARFMVEDKNITRSLKRIRHAATNIILDSKKISFKKILQTRSIKTDYTKFLDFKKPSDVHIVDIFMSNIERTKESLRVLEECCKLIDESASCKYRELRFNAYDIEKKAIKKIRHISSN